MSDAYEAKDKLIARMREQHETITGHAPDAKTARAIEKQATKTAEAVMATKNRESRYQPRRR